MRLLDAGSDVQIEIHIDNGVTNIEKRTTLAEEQLLEDAVMLKPNTLDGKLVGLRSTPELRVDLIWVFEDTVWKIKGAEVDTVKVNGKPYYRVKGNIDGTKDNRREAYREFIGTNMSLYKLPEKANVINVYLRDLSETGFAFTTEEVMDVGEKVLLKFRYYEMETLIRGVIVRVQEQDLGFMYGCKIRSSARDMGQMVAEIQRIKRYEKLNR